MLNTLKLLVNHFRPKTQIRTTGSTSKKSKETEQLEHREKLVSVRNHMDELTTTNAFDVNAIRQKVHEDLRASDVSARQKDRASINKWFNKCDLTDSGSFDITAFQRRMEEMTRAEEEIYMEALPAQEDMMLAFGKPEHDFFENEKISLSGVFLRVNPNEDFEDEYRTPSLPVYHSNDDAVPKNETELVEEPIVCEEYDLSVSVQETSEGLIPDAMSLPALESNSVSIVGDAAPTKRYECKIDPSILFVERFTEACFDLSSVKDATDVIIECFADEALEALSEEVLAKASSLLVETSAPVEGLNHDAKRVSKTKANSIAKPAEKYWTESDRLKRFGRRKTSAFCSSTRLPALTQIA